VSLRNSDLVFNGLHNGQGIDNLIFLRCGKTSQNLMSFYIYYS
jgi:hypothetical protein